jgi:trigger factor
MEAQLEQLGGDRVRLTVEVPASEVHHAVEHATHDLADRVKVPGFRAGKVPREVLLQRIGRQRLLSEAVETHISSWFWSAARTNRLRPTQQPDYDYELPTASDESWQFKAEFPVQPPVVPADWTTLEVPKLDVEVNDSDEVVQAQLTQLQGVAATLSAVEDRPARPGDVAVVDIFSDEGTGQRDYVLELGAARLADEIEERIRGLLVGDTDQVPWQGRDGVEHNVAVTLKELYEKVLPPLDDSLAAEVSEFDTLDQLRADIVERIRKLLEREVENQFRVTAVDELLRASKVEPASLVVEMRTRDLLNAFVRQLEARGVDPVGYLRAAGVSGAELEQRFREEAAQSIGRELLLEAVADKLAIDVTDDEIRADLKEDGESEEDIEEFFTAGGADRVRPDLRLKKAVDRIAAEVKPISQELANARESIWTPGKEEGVATEKKLWTPGDKE